MKYSDFDYHFSRYKDMQLNWSEMLQVKLLEETHMLNENIDRLLKKLEQKEVNIGVQPNTGRVQEGIQAQANKEEAMGRRRR